MKKHISEKLIITIRDLSIEKMLEFNEKGNLIPYSPIKIKLNAPKTWFYASTTSFREWENKESRFWL